MSVNQRNSSFELLRIIAQYMIIVYHIFCFWYVQHPSTCEVTQPVYTAIWFPLHIGVILFVLISGYWGIKLKWSGLLRIIANLFVYGLCFSLIFKLLYHEHIPIRLFSFVGNTGYWYVRTYLLLYLLSPLVNGFLRKVNGAGRVVLLLILAYFSCYVGWKGYDPSLVDGKNLVNFLLIYSIGDTLRLYAEKIKQIPVWLIAILYTCLNVTLVVGYILHPSSVLYSYAFPYNSIVLLLNAVLFFVLFMHLKIESKFVNGVASSMLAVYLIHESPLIFKTVIRDSAYYIQTISSSVGVNIFGVCLLAALCMVACVLIDKSLTPAWTLTQKIAAKLDSSRAGEWLRDYAHVE